MAFFENKLEILDEVKMNMKQKTAKKYFQLRFLLSNWISLLHFEVTLKPFRT